MRFTIRSRALSLYHRHHTSKLHNEQPLLRTANRRRKYVRIWHHGNDKRLLSETNAPRMVDSNHTKSNQMNRNTKRVDRCIVSNTYTQRHTMELIALNTYTQPIVLLVRNHDPQIFERRKRASERPKKRLKWRKFETAQRLQLSANSTQSSQNNRRFKCIDIDFVRFFLCRSVICSIGCIGFLSIASFCSLLRSLFVCLFVKFHLVYLWKFILFFVVVGRDAWTVFCVVSSCHC